LLLAHLVSGQIVPNEIENIEYLVTFGKNGDTSWGDDDFMQVYFFSIPASYQEPFYIRIYDPDTGGNIDEIKGKVNTRTKFSFIGGKYAYTNFAPSPKGKEENFLSGTLLDSREFGSSTEYDQQWYTMGPFFSVQGEYIPNEKSYYFKLVAEGLAGDDGNLYKYSLSTDPVKNTEVLGSNAFTYSYTFRVPHDPSRVTHIYPFITNDVVSIEVHNFDFDHGGHAYIYSVSKNRHPVTTGGDDQWKFSKHTIDPEEKNSSIDIQVINNGMINNNIVIFITNQLNSPIPFYTIPIGGPPKYKYKVSLEYIDQPAKNK
jgi:hypothetical protein